jgi:tRNA(fMet)-specific endonuclease VapC
VEQKVCLDTDVVIAMLNNEERAKEIINQIEDDTVFITTITFFELLLRKTNLQAIEIFRNKVYILDFDEEAARKASTIFKELQKKGRTTDIRDVFIAATCITHKCRLGTFNKKHFDQIKELHLVC